MKSTIDCIIDELRAVQRLRLALGVAEEAEHTEEHRRLCNGESTDGMSQRKTRDAIAKHCFRLEQAAISHILTALDGGGRPGWDDGGRSARELKDVLIVEAPPVDLVALAELVKKELDRILAEFNKHDNGGGHSSPEVPLAPPFFQIDDDKVKPK